VAAADIPTRDHLKTIQSFQPTLQLGHMMPDAEIDDMASAAAASAAASLPSIRQRLTEAAAASFRVSIYPVVFGDVSGLSCRWICF